MLNLICNLRGDYKLISVFIKIQKNVNIRYYNHCISSCFFIEWLRL